MNRDVEMEVRRYRPDDDLAVVAFAVAAAAEDPSLRPLTIEGWRAFLALPENRDGHDFAVAAEVDGAVAGLCTSTLRGTPPDLVRHFRIIVAPPWRGRGLATRLYEHLPQDAPRQCVLPGEWTRGREVLLAHRFVETRRDLAMTRPPAPVAAASAVTVRAATPDDDEALARVSNAGYAGSYGYTPVAAATFAARRQVPGSRFWVALHDRRVVGYCHTILEDEELGCIESLVVEPHLQRRGIGRALLAAGLEQLRTDGRATTVLWVDAENRAAVSLYEDHGFATSGFTSTFRSPT